MPVQRDEGCGGGPVSFRRWTGGDVEEVYVGEEDEYKVLPSLSGDG